MNSIEAQKTTQIVYETLYMHDLFDMIYSEPSVVYGIWYMVYGIGYTVDGIWYIVYSRRYMVYGIRRVGPYKGWFLKSPVPWALEEEFSLCGLWTPTSGPRSPGSAIEVACLPCVLLAAISNKAFTKRILGGFARNEGELRRNAVHSSKVTWKWRGAPYKPTILWTGPSMCWQLVVLEATNIWQLESYSRQDFASQPCKLQSPPGGGSPSCAFLLGS